MTIAPRRFEGVRRIVRFNWPFYVAALAVLGAALYALAVLNGGWRLAALVIAIGAAWSVFGSLLASWWIYDLSSLCRTRWFHAIRSPEDAHTILNVHTGYDDTTPGVRNAYPAAELRVVRVSSPTIREPSLARARRLFPSSSPAEAARPELLPGADASCNLLLLLFAAHELRTAAARIALFTECARLVRADGRIVVTEHLRDLANGIAFGPGALHFHSRRIWLSDIAAAGLRIEREIRTTPFVTSFVIQRA